MSCKACPLCCREFNQDDLQSHIERFHIGINRADVWNCGADDCPFQAVTFSEIGNHCLDLRHAVDKIFKEKDRLLIGTLKKLQEKLEQQGSYHNRGENSADLPMLKPANHSSESSYYPPQLNSSASAPLESTRVPDEQTVGEVGGAQNDFEQDNFTYALSSIANDSTTLETFMPTDSRQAPSVLLVSSSKPLDPQKNAAPVPQMNPLATYPKTPLPIISGGRQSVLSVPVGYTPIPTSDGGDSIVGQKEAEENQGKYRNADDSSNSLPIQHRASRGRIISPIHDSDDEEEEKDSVHRGQDDKEGKVGIHPLSSPSHSPHQTDLDTNLTNSPTNFALAEMALQYAQSALSRATPNKQKREILKSENQTPKRLKLWTEQEFESELLKQVMKKIDGDEVKSEVHKMNVSWESQLPYDRSPSPSSKTNRSRQMSPIGENDSANMSLESQEEWTRDSTDDTEWGGISAADNSESSSITNSNEIRCHLCSRVLKGGRSKVLTHRLIIHSAVHFGDLAMSCEARPFRCGRCDSLFSGENSIRYHLKNSHAIFFGQLKYIFLSDKKSKEILIAAAVRAFPKDVSRDRAKVYYQKYYD